MTSGPDPGEFPGLWGSMVFRHAPIPPKGSGNQQQQQQQDIIESEDSVNGQLSPEKCNDASSIVRNQTTSADDKFTVGSGEESNSEDSSEHDSDDLTARSSFAGKNGRVWFTTCPPPSRTHARNLRHTNEDQLVLQKPSKIKFILLLTLLMNICLSRLSNTLTSVLEGTSEKEAKIQMNGCHLTCVK